MTRPRTDLHTDLYQLSMAAGYFHRGVHRKRVSFELFVRRLPPHRRYMVFAGLETVLDHLRNLRFTEAHLDYLRTVPALRPAMSFELQEYLRDFRFSGEVWAMPEGTVAFAQEPLIRVTGTLFEAQLVETFLLSAVNTETAAASKAARVVTAAQGRPVLEFGTRRTSPEEAVQTARAAYLAGFAATSNVEAGYRWDIPLAGTAAHSWTMAHPTEREAFEAYLAVYPEARTTLLVDTYDTLDGVRNAIRAASAGCAWTAVTCSRTRGSLAPCWTTQGSRRPGSWPPATSTRPRSRPSSRPTPPSTCSASGPSWPAASTAPTSAASTRWCTTTTRIARS